MSIEDLFNKLCAFRRRVIVGRNDYNEDVTEIVTIYRDIPCALEQYGYDEHIQFRQNPLETVNTRSRLFASHDPNRIVKIGDFVVVYDNPTDGYSISEFSSSSSSSSTESEDNVSSSSSSNSSSSSQSSSSSSSDSSSTSSNNGTSESSSSTSSDSSTSASSESSSSNSSSSSHSSSSSSSTSSSSETSSLSSSSSTEDQSTSELSSSSSSDSSSSLSFVGYPLYIVGGIHDDVYRLHHSVYDLEKVDFSEGNT